MVPSDAVITIQQPKVLHSRVWRELLLSWSGDVLKGCFMGGTFSITPRYKKGRRNPQLKGNKHRNRFATSI